ncbi:MAG: hypothetical protein XD84_0393 [Desulfotomaculum sp. 46_80]|nr:MAG: hypothetical protein XD84_0393 [Desulfotomaculum sp. 46_80]
MRKISKKKFLILSAATILALGAIGIGVVTAHNNDRSINAVKLFALKPSANNSSG